MLAQVDLEEKELRFLIGLLMEYSKQQDDQAEADKLKTKLLNALEGN